MSEHRSTVHRSTGTASTVRGLARPTRVVLAGVLPTTLLAAALGMAPAALAAGPSDSGSAHARTAAAMDRARTWTQAALRASTLAAPALSPRAVSKITGPALVFSQVTTAGSSIGWSNLTNGAAASLPRSPYACVMEARLSPDGTRIVAITNANGDCDSGAATVSTIVVATGVATTLVSLPAGSSDTFSVPNWSKDGSTILYTLNQEGGSQLYTVPAAGGTPTALTNGANLLDGVYSPDGTKVAAGDYADDNLTVLTLGTTVRTTVPAMGAPERPAWSPDGSLLSFSYDKAQAGGHNYGLAVTKADGSGTARTLSVTTADPTTDVFSSSWSDDGTQILYDAFGQDPASKVPTVAPAIYATDAQGLFRSTIKASSGGTVYLDPAVVRSAPLPTPPPSTYHPIAPVRVLARTAVGPAAYRDVKVAGVGSIPTGVSAVTLNLTGAAPTAATYLTAYPKPSGTGYPVVSNLNLAARQTAAIAVQVAVSADGYVRIRNAAGTTGVIVDVSGYFTEGVAGAGYLPLTAPVRALDTTIGSRAGRALTLPGAPAGAVAVVLNLTGAHPSATTWEAVVPSPLVATPAVSNLNLPAGTTRANLVTAKIGPDGKVVVYNAAGSVRTIVDVLGYYISGSGGLAYYPLAPARILDTRNGTHTWLGRSGPLGPGGKLDLPTLGSTITATGYTAVPTWAKAVAFNLTGVTPSAATYLSLAASPATTNTSSVNLPKGGTVPNLVISTVGTAPVGSTSWGAVRIYNAAGQVPIVADLAGFYAPPVA
jgi:hypothetical protein